MKHAPAHNRHRSAGTLAEAQQGDPPVVTPVETPLSTYVRFPELLNSISGVGLRNIAKRALNRIRELEGQPKVKNGLQPL